MAREATVAKRMEGEIRLDGANVAVVMFHPVASKTTPWRPAQRELFVHRASTNQIAIKWDGQATGRPKDVFGDNVGIREQTGMRAKIDKIIDSFPE